MAFAVTLAKCVKRGDKVTVCHVSNGNLGHVIIPPDELAVMRKGKAKKPVVLQVLKLYVLISATFI